MVALELQRYQNMDQSSSNSEDNVNGKFNALPLLTVDALGSTECIGTDIWLLHISIFLRTSSHDDPRPNFQTTSAICPRRRKGSSSELLLASHRLFE